MRLYGFVSGTVLVYLVGSLVLSRTAAAWGVPIDPTAGLVLGLGVVFGPTVAVGAGIGSVLTDVLTGTLGPDTAFSYAVAFLLAYVANVFWNTLGRYERFRRTGGVLLRFVLAILPAILTAAVVGAWGAEVLARAPFATAFEEMLVGSLLGALTLGFLALAVSRWLVDTDTIVPPPTRTVFANRRWVLVASTVPFLWGLGGFTLSVALQPFQLKYPQIIANRFGWPVASLLNDIGPSGRALQFALGTVALGLVLFALFGGTVEARD